MVSGSGDATVRVWDVVTATPRLTLKGSFALLLMGSDKTP